MELFLAKSDYESNLELRNDSLSVKIKFSIKDSILNKPF